VLTERLPINSDELATLIDDLLHEMTGLGPIELCSKIRHQRYPDNTHEHVYIERAGQLEKVRYCSATRRTCCGSSTNRRRGRAPGRRVATDDGRSPARRLRVNVAVRPVAVDGPLVSIRKFSKRPYSLERLTEINTLRPQMATLLAAAVKTASR